MIKLDLEKYSHNPEILEQEFYLNQTNTILYSFNPNKNVVGKSFKGEFDIVKLPVMIEKIKKGEKEVKHEELTFLEIIKEENDIVKNVKPTCKTLEPSGFYYEKNSQYLEVPCLNEYTNSTPFIKSLEKLKKIRLTLPLTEEGLIEFIYDKFIQDCPHISFLIHNLFWEESINVIVNFLSFLSIVGFKDKHQDIFYLFKGQSEDKQGQGAGKGVIQQLLTKLFSGLVIGVNNNTYNTTFNSRLQNMKIVIFDEVNFKKMNYEVVKNITGNSSLPIEFKGKESMETKNVSSWLFFTNEYDLLNKLNQNDRRCILIEPNPINSSLETRVRGELDTDMSSFIDNLESEITEFIGVLSFSTLVEPKKPQDLKSNSHIRYYSQKSKVKVDMIDFYKIFTNKEHLKKYVSFVNDIGVIENQKGMDKYIYSSENIQFFIENKTIYYEMVLEMYNICKKYQIGFTKTFPAPLKVWGILKERLISNFEYEPYTYEMKPTKKNMLSKKFSKTGLQDKSLVKKEKSKTKLTNRTKKIYQEVILSLVKNEEIIPF